MHLTLQAPNWFRLPPRWASRYMSDLAQAPEIDDQATIDSLARVSARLRRSGLTFAVAESFTGGGLTSALLATQGSEAWFRGSLVTQDPEVVQGVFEAADWSAPGAATAEAMAQSIVRLMHADAAVAVTRARTAGGPHGHDVQDEGGTWIAVLFDGESTLHLIYTTDDAVILRESLLRLEMRLDGLHGEPSIADVAAPAAGELAQELLTSAEDPTFPGPDPGGQSTG